MIDLTRARKIRLPRTVWALATLLIAPMSGCGSGGMVSSGPVSKPEDIISGKATLVNQKTGTVSEPPVPSDYGPPPKK